MRKTISQTENGIIFKCASCSKIHIVYKNLNFNFDKEEYEKFAKYFEELNGHYWEYLNKKSPYQRKIQLPIGLKNFNILLNNDELREIKQLFADANVDQPEIIANFKFNINNN